LLWGGRRGREGEGEGEGRERERYQQIWTNKFCSPSSRVQATCFFLLTGGRRGEEREEKGGEGREGEGEGEGRERERYQQIWTSKVCSPSSRVQATCFLLPPVTRFQILVKTLPNKKSATGRRRELGRRLQATGGGRQLEAARREKAAREKASGADNMEGEGGRRREKQEKGGRRREKEGEGSKR
jgi:hypothetical protein